MKQAESPQRIVYFDLDVKIWAKNPPSVAAARPPTCPCCGRAGAPAGAPIGVVGHGLRERTVLGPWSSASAPEEVTFHARRYRCLGCEAVLSVVPRGVLRGMVYGALAIALALALWLTEPSWRVRGRVSPRRGADSEREHGWRAVSRWARDATRLWPWLRLGTCLGRHRAEQMVQQLAARAARQGGGLVDLACDGALRS